MHFSKPPLGTPLDWGNPLNDETVLALALNEGHGDKVQDLSLNGNHGTLNNFAFPPTVASGWNPGQTGIGLNFDGINDDVSCGNNQSLLCNTGFTVNMLIHPHFDIGAVGGAAADRIGIYQNARNCWCMFRDGKQHLMVRDSVGGYHNIYGVKNSWNVNEWYILTQSYSPTAGFALYVNGVADGVAAVVGDLNVGAVAPVIGYYNKYFDGAIDQPRVQCRAWTAKEVKDYAINPWQVYLDADD